MTTGTIRKLRSEHKNIIEYRLPLSEEEVLLNPYIGKKITLEFTGNKYCIASGRKVKQTYGQGYAWEEFVTLPECDQCIVRPELCHFHKGTCRDPEWGEKRCFAPHVVYLSVTNDLKVGITRQTQVPTRWIDQGATKAIKICEVKDRKTSGEIEVKLAKELKDKTHWIKMLKGESVDVDLVAKKKEVLKKFDDIFSRYSAKVLDDEVYEFNFPIEGTPDKIKQLNFDKTPTIEGVLLGIKGQYLLFEQGVLNIRKHQGFEITLK